MATKIEYSAEFVAARQAVQAGKAEWLASLESGDKSVEAAAVAVFAALPFTGEGDEMLYPSRDALRAEFPGRNRNDKGEREPIAPSYLTLLNRLGKAHSVGVTPESEPVVWARLVQKANSDKRIRAAIDDEKATKAKIVKAVRSAYPGGAYKAEPKASDKADTTGEGQETAAEKVTVPANVSNMLDMLETLALRLSTEPITPAEFARLAAVVETLGSVTASDVDTVEAKRSA